MNDTTEQLAAKMFTREHFEKGLELNFDALSNIFPPLILREIKWLSEGRFEQHKEKIKESLEIYTPEEQEVLLNLYKDHPWLAKKQIAFGVDVHKKSIPMAEALIEEAIKNLEELGELEGLDDERS